jgi:hypothetical protein
LLVLVRVDHVALGRRRAARLAVGVLLVDLEALHVVAAVLDVDLEAALSAKIIKNAEKYPVRAARSSAAKYTDLASPEDTAQ